MSAGVIIQGKFYRTKADGVAGMGNVQHGIDIYNSTNNVIGGAASGAGNRIGFASVGFTSAYAGVRVRTGAFNNLISGNSIFNTARWELI